MSESKTLTEADAKQLSLVEELRLYRRWIGADEGLIPVSSNGPHPLMTRAADRICELETELSAALQREKELQEAADDAQVLRQEYLQRAEKAEGERDEQVERRICAEDVARQAEAELSRYREAEKALPEEPDYKEAQDFMRSAFVVDRTVYDALRAHAAAVTAERDAMREEIYILRQYGNKDCTAMADSALAEMRNIRNAARKETP